MQDDLAAIVAGLTLGERIILRNLEAVNAGGSWGFFRPAPKAFQLARQKKLIAPDHAGGNVILPLGQAAAALIARGVGE